MYLYMHKKCPLCDLEDNIIYYYYLKLLQHIFHLGPEAGSNSNSPFSHLEQLSINRRSLFCGHEDWGQVAHVIGPRPLVGGIL